MIPVPSLDCNASACCVGFFAWSDRSPGIPRFMPAFALPTVSLLDTLLLLSSFFAGLGDIGNHGVSHQHRDRQGAEVRVSASDYAAQDELDMQRLGNKQ